MGRKRKNVPEPSQRKQQRGLCHPHTSSCILTLHLSWSHFQYLPYTGRGQKKKKQLVVMPQKRKIYSHSLTIWSPLLSTKYVLSCIELPSLELQTLVSLGYNLGHIVSFHKVAHYRPLSSLALQRAFPIFPSAVSFPTKSFKCQRIIYKRARGKF